jgi:hypothetical protein
MTNIHAVFRPEFTRLILEQLRDRPMDTSGGAVPPAKGISQTTHPANPSLSWEPSPAARLLADISARNDDKPPIIKLRVVGVSPEQIAAEVRSAIDRSGISYHSHLAQTVADGGSLLNLTTPAPAAHPFDSAAMLAMTGQLHTRITTALGDAAIVFHRTEDDAQPNSPGYRGRITSASLAVDHPDLGAIIAHLSLTGSDIVATIRCNASSAATVETATPQLLRGLWEAGMLPVINVTPLPHD